MITLKSAREIDRMAESGALLAELPPKLVLKITNMPLAAVSTMRFVTGSPEKNH